MRKVITINLNGRAYQLEEDGYHQLQRYLQKAEAALSDDLIERKAQREALRVTGGPAQPGRAGLRAPSGAPCDPDAGLPSGAPCE